MTPGEKNGSPPGAPGKAAIEKMLAYTGPSSRQSEPIKDGVVLIDFRATDQNERNLTALLSAQRIPFHLEPPSNLGLRKGIRFDLTVPQNRYDEAAALLKLAVETSMLDVVEGTSDLLQR